MTNRQDFEIYIIVNDEGEYSIAKTEADAMAEMRKDLGGTRFRNVKLTVTITLPSLHEVPVNVPHDTVTESVTESDDSSEVPHSDPEGYPNVSHEDEDEED
jgi:hypothetical protein